MPRHRHWPVTMQAGGVVLRPMRRADEVRWTTTRELDWDWLGPWEATKPPGSHERVGGYRMMITRNRRRAKQGTSLPWAIGWDDGWPDHPALNRDTTPLIGQLTVSSISFGSAMSCSMGYWVASAYAGRGLHRPRWRWRAITSSRSWDCTASRFACGQRIRRVCASSKSLAWQRRGCGRHTYISTASGATIVCSAY